MNICNARLHSSMKQSRRLLFFVCQLFPSTPDWSVVILGTKRALVPLQTFIESGCESLRMQGGCSAAELWPSCGEAKIKENFPAGCNTGSESKEHEMLLQKSQKTTGGLSTLENFLWTWADFEPCSWLSPRFICSSSQNSVQSFWQSKNYWLLNHLKKCQTIKSISVYTTYLHCFHLFTFPI